MEYIELLFWPIATALLLSLITSPLGVFVVWQKQSYFGATLAHSALLGVSLSIILNTPLTISVMATSIFIALCVFYLARKSDLSTDTLLGILAHSSLAFGIAVISLQDQVQIDLMSYLFGDILNAHASDFLWVMACGIAVLIYFKLFWRLLLNITFNPELAQVEGISVKSIQLAFVLLLAITIALSMKIVGVLLVTSLLIIPAASARKLAKTPEQMLVATAMISLISVIIGLFISIIINIPTGASIVIASSLLFLSLQIRHSVSQ